MKTKKPETEQDLIDALASLLDQEGSDQTIDEVDEELRAAGLEPAEVGERFANAARKAYRESPHHWRQRARVERAGADDRLRRRLDSKSPLSRAETLSAIQAITARSPELRAHFRNFERATDEDLAGLLAELELLEEEETEGE